MLALLARCRVVASWTLDVGVMTDKLFDDVCVMFDVSFVVIH